MHAMGDGGREERGWFEMVFVFTRMALKDYE
jgi:hypothetical protein